MKPNIKKLLILNAPYLLFVYLFDKVGQAVRLSPGADLSGKLLSIGSGFSAAFSNALPSFAPMDLLIGIVWAVVIRLAVYVKGKNAKKYRKGMEYGSARWGNAEDIKPYIDPIFENNVLLTQTGYREKFYNTAQSLFSLTQDLGDWVTKGLTVTVKGSFDAKNYNHLARTKTPPQYMASGRDEFGDLILQQKVVGTDNLTYAESHSGYRSVYLEASVNWARSFGKHDLSALFLYQQSQRNDVGIDKSEPELALPYRHQGIAGRITYSYDNRYFIEGNFGYNGSENFSPGKRFGFFPR